MIELKRHNVHRMVDSEEKAKELISEGFTIIMDEKKEIEKEITDYADMTVDQLRNICRENSLEGFTNLLKDDLISFMKEKIKG